MSLIALFMALLLFPLHACNARSTFAFVDAYTKHTEKAKPHETHIKVFPALDTKETILAGGKTKSMDTLDKNQRAMGIMKGLMEKVRSMLESTSQETEEPTHANEDESLGDVVVTDYVQPHRKSPIHNHH